MIKGIIFDLDGTLLNSLNVWEKVDYLFLKKRNVEITKDYSEALLHMKFLEAAKYTIERYSLNETIDEVMNEWMQFAEELYQTEVTLKIGAYEFVHQLKQKGIQLAILTSCHQELFEPCLKKHGIFELFDVIVEANKVQLNKTQPEIYHHVLSQMNLSADSCLFFDDVCSSLSAAKQVGIQVIGVNDPLSFHEDMKQLTSTIISDFTQINTTSLF